MPRLTHTQLVGGGLVFATALAIRLPFTSTYLWAWDSVLYARAIEVFSVASGRPHPPGYLFYVLLARLATWLTGEANAGLVAVSILGGAGTAAVGFLVGARVFGSAAGALAAAILVADPLLWHYSEVAYPYTLLALLSGTVGGLLWWSRSGHPGRTLVASLALALASGFRQDLLLLLGPLWLWAILGRGRRTVVASVIALLVGCLAWLVPTALLSGGLERYLTMTGSQVLGVATFGPTPPQGMRDNLFMIAIGLRWQIHWALPLAPLGVWVLLRNPDLRWRSVPLALWTLPALLTYLLLHIGDWGYALSLAVPLALLAGIGGSALLDVARPRLVRAAVAAGIIAALFLNAHSFVLGDGRFSARAIQGHDAGLAIRFAAFRERFPASETIIIAGAGIQWARYYLPEYRSFYVPPGVQLSPRTLPVGPEVRRVVLFLGEIGANARTPVRTLALTNGVEIRYVPLQRHWRVIIEHRLVLVESE